MDTEIAGGPAQGPPSSSRIGARVRAIRRTGPPVVVADRREGPRDASVSVGCAPSFNHQFSSGCSAGGCEANLPVSSIEDGEVCYTDGAQHGRGSGWCCRPNNGQCDVAANCD